MVIVPLAASSLPCSCLAGIGGLAASWVVRAPIADHAATWTGSVLMAAGIPRRQRHFVSTTARNSAAFQSVAARSCCTDTTHIQRRCVRSSITAGAGSNWTYRQWRHVTSLCIRLARFCCRSGNGLGPSRDRRLDGSLFLAHHRCPHLRPDSGSVRWLAGLLILTPFSRRCSAPAAPTRICSFLVLAVGGGIGSTRSKRRRGEMDRSGRPRFGLFHQTDTVVLHPFWSSGFHRSTHSGRRPVQLGCVISPLFFLSVFVAVKFRSSLATASWARGTFLPLPIRSSPWTAQSTFVCTATRAGLLRCSPLRHPGLRPRWVATSCLVPNERIWMILLR